MYSRTPNPIYSTTPSPVAGVSKRNRSPPPPNPVHTTSSETSEDLADYSVQSSRIHGRREGKNVSQPPSSEHQTAEEDEEETQEIPLLTTQEEFIQAIKKWVATDNQLRILNARTKEAREQRQLLTQQIHQYVDDNNLDYPSIEISDGELILCEKREYSSLTFSYIDRCLSQLLKEPAHVDRILSVLRENRECYIVPEIRRSSARSMYKKPT